MKTRKYVILALMLGTSLALQAQTAKTAKTTETAQATPTKTPTVPFKVMSLPKNEEEWKKKLTPEEYSVLRDKDTERPYVGKYDQFWEPGTYVCKGCGTELFSSKTKFDAGCGWPSFYAGIDKSKIIEVVDNSFGMRRVEVQCAVCKGHLGHVFDDGPAPTGLRYCINSLSLGFKKKE